MHLDRRRWAGASRMGVIVSALALTGARAAAHDEQGGPVHYAEALAPGMLCLGAAVAVALGVGVWYHLTRRAMLASSRGRASTRGEPASRP